MHEYSLMQGVIDTILQALPRRGIEPVRHHIDEVILTVGALAIHSDDSCRQAFEMLSAGTALEGAGLRLTIVPATIACSACGYSGACPQDRVDPHAAAPVAECPRCGGIASVTGSRGVESIDLAVSDLAAGDAVRPEARAG